jgi:hypothetical protein
MGLKPLGLRADVVPDSSLRVSVRERVGRQELGLAPPQCRIGGVPSRHERRTARTPSPLLDARDRNPGLAHPRQKYADIEDSVLFRSHELLPVVKQDVRVERILRQELRHRAGRIDLGHAEAERDRLLERDVLRTRLPSREQRRNDDAAVHDRLA